MALEIRLDRYDRTYMPGEVVRGVVVLSNKGGMQHNGISMVVDGQFMLQLSPKSTGLFEAFYSSLKPVQLLAHTIQIAQPGKIPDGEEEIPFEFKLAPLDGEKLHDTYHGVYVNVQYSITCECPRPLLAKNLKKVVEFIINSPATTKSAPDPKPTTFKITPQSLENIRPGSAARIPRFMIHGRLDSTVCNIVKPLTGMLTVEEAEAEIRSLEIQLVRVETCGTSEGMAKEASEIQSIQVADGNVTRKFEIPLYMIFPRLFTCPTVSVKQFKVDFEVNLVVHFMEGYTITENFPIKLYR
mmetsp:Transcript_34710/g.79172  ORF Transcript_34710/g.79172 Transcript_34710/m.79172 type:complete len:298 (+) Transcript_34710:3-896(+)